ncbi:hypothetical protein AB0G60_20800 [Streptomyces angustmyceticus]|uniref:Uncharacterized protein n=1 Tax=Streptomyces angustmyceticus TaxID=285578 RepID=A0A5J4LAL3_9ACTN|nr:hypothetical protein [Streptomyces angustmyceticus]UAL66587.1 hypothetical protein K7396_08605 [Streptomyces angustmyceticus]GES28569.1 hypothetical protein San01_10560 [Streptomyces angustmyceticus]
MEATRRTTAEPARLGDPGTQRAFGRAKFLVAAYGALSSAVLAAVAVRALTGHPVTSFLWGRSAGVLASAAVTYWLTVLAARGARWAFLRVRLVSVVMPVAIVGVDLIPGVCPAWFVLAQATCALAVGAAACVVHGPLLRAAFRRAR